MGLLEEVELEGALPFGAVERCYASADLFIFSGVVARNGDRAGFPNAIAEAMAWGVPVAATPVGGVAEVIQDDLNGIVLTFDPCLDARRIASLLEDPAACARFSRAGREWIETHFRADRAMQELLRLINANS
jgi:glycosyltransferase involved in cell wall biosynthesis